MNQWRRVHVGTLLVFLLLCSGLGLTGALRAISIATQEFGRTIASIIGGFVALNLLLRMRLQLLVPPLIASASHVFKVIPPLALIVLVAVWAKVFVGLPEAAGQLLAPGPLGTPERMGQALATVGDLIFFQEWLFSLGYPPGVYGKARDPYVQTLRFSFMCYIVAGMVAAAMIDGVLLPTTSVIAMMIAHSFWQTRAAARTAYHKAEVACAKDATLQILPSTSWCVHITDVHLTTANKRRAEGGRGGNEALRHAAQQLGQSKLPFVFITGDLTDHGDREEWNEARRLLAPLVRGGSRVLVAPGNHDLMTAYNSSETWVSVAYGHFRGADITWLNGMRLRAYLKLAAKLEPSLTASNGRLLREVLLQETKEFRRLAGLLERARRVTQSRPSDGDALAMFHEEANRILVNLEISRLGLGNELTEEGLAKLRADMEREAPSLWAATLSSKKTKGDFLLTEWFGWYSTGWYDYFPLRTFDPQTNTEIVVLNSIANFMGLLGSAWGYLSRMQMYRLERLVRSSHARQIVVLIHHAPFRWEGEPFSDWVWGDLQRWACLAATGGPTDEFVQILRDAQLDGKGIYLFCGHRHGGVLELSRVGAWTGGEVAEGASLAQQVGALICGWVQPSGKLQLGTLESSGMSLTSGGQ